MASILLSVHLLLCIVLIGLVLLQQGKGADAGAAFGGSSASLFGASGATAMITKVTTGIAIAFMITSILLVRVYAAGGFVSTAHSGDLLANSVMKDVVAAPGPSDSSAEKKAVDPAAAVVGDPAVATPSVAPAVASPSVPQAAVSPSEAKVQVSAPPADVPAGKKTKKPNGKGERH